MQFVLLKEPRRIIYMISPSKSSKDVFTAYDPFDSRRVTFTKDEVASDEILREYSYIPVRDNVWNVRPIEQLTLILFDISGSMQNTKGSNTKSLLDLSITALGTWCDKFCGNRLPHAVGLIYCGAKETARAQLVYEACPITTNYIDFEKSFSTRPDCGSHTPLYDAIEFALDKMIQYYEQHKSKMSPNFQKLIICLSDGEDTCSKMTLPRITERLQKDHVIFDSICFRDKEAQSLVHLCTSSKGYYYLPIPQLEKDLITLFEREPVMSVNKRNKNVYGVVKEPILCEPEALHVPATKLEEVPVKDIVVSNETLNRVFREANNLKLRPPEHFIIFVCKDNILFWKIIMNGPPGSRYCGYRWLLSVEFPSHTYPLRPPDIRFITPIYHCNISDDGKICHEILRSHWTKQTSMYDVLQQIISLLFQPEPNDALSTAKGDLFKRSEDDYFKELQQHNKKYANATIEELKNQYQLEQFSI
ncbi:unnamed protein product [Rotaria sp. Silwood1]|nr:unnamed protein product [Rotaria sp. Silwood1]CAF1633284.1 unnamed protein product [Rotaria sp. Silwood1]CAF3829177.1 unnamed protein product [Rotaria sp. Silwood1]CAF3906712.1 unnamed protein product [Rotaria sp. Silwood1]